MFWTFYLKLWQLKLQKGGLVFISHSNRIFKKSYFLLLLSEQNIIDLSIFQIYKGQSLKISRFFINFLGSIKFYARIQFWWTKIILFENKNWLNIPNNIVTECHMKLMVYISTLQVIKELSNDTTKYMQFFAANYKWQATEKLWWL